MSINRPYPSKPAWGAANLVEFIAGIKEKLKAIFVSKAGNETIGGIKTFTSSPVVPTPAADSDTTVPATTEWVNDAIDVVNGDISSLDANVVKKSGNQEISGTKTFLNGIIAPYEALKRPDNTTGMWLFGGSSTDATAGAKLFLTGGSNETIANQGRFLIQAGNASGYKQFIGKPDGTLTWDGKDIITNGGDQTVGGMKTFTDTIITQSTAGMRKQDTSQFLQFGFTTVLNGGRLNLFGKDYYDTNAKGAFAIQTGDGSGSHILQGQTDGKLLWDSKDVITNGGAQNVGGAKTFTDNITVKATSPRLFIDTTSTNTASEIHFQRNGTDTGGVALTANDSVLIATKSGKTYWYQGACLTLQTNGNFDLRATNTSASKSLIGAPDGALTWDGKDIITNGGDQTVGGTKTFTAGIIAYTYPAMRMATTTDAMQLWGGSSANASAGAKIILNGGSRTADPGMFTVQAGDSSSYKQLIGRPNGTFTWNGQNIQVGSDERIKTAIGDFPDDVLDAWSAVRWEQFKYREDAEQKGVENCRFHAGLVTQHVQQAMQAQGVDPLRYGILCHEEWQDETDEEGNIIREAGDLWMVRYTEALCMEAAYQRRRADRAEARITALERRLDEMEAVLATLGGMEAAE